MSAPPSEDFVPIHPNPYIVGNPIRGSAMFFGREAEFELVRRRFTGQSRGGLLVFCGERRSGKTSILFQITEGRLGPEFIPVLIDMQSMAIVNEVGFLERIATEILDAAPDSAGLRFEPLAAGSTPTAQFQRFVEAVLAAHPGLKVILLFDEYELFENKIDSGILSEDVLYILSSLMERQAVFVIFTGSRSLEARRREYWKILGKSIYKTISYLEHEDAVRLIRKPVEGAVQFEDGAVDRICRLTAGQPFYTQAICQSLVDRLNEIRSRTATRTVLDEVVSYLIENPLPQMIFLWDSLEPDEKVVLALLAEGLDDPAAHAGAGDLLRRVRRHEYPLEIGRARMATVLEKLFKQELLLKAGAAAAPVYAFRMDLWRLWIRRMHSVWQVVREVGVSVTSHRTLGRRLRRPLSIIVPVVALGAVALGWMMRRGSAGGAPESGGAGPAAWLSLEVTPRDANAMIFDDGRAIGTNTFHGAILADRDHDYRISAVGYFDTTLRVRVPAGDSSTVAVSLRPHVGDLLVETDPPGARISLDGRERGLSPIRIPDLASARRHSLEASMSGRETIRRSLAVTEGTVTTTRIELPKARRSVYVASEPPGARVLVDGTARGETPVVLADFPLGKATIGFRREGMAALDTVVDVGEDTREVRVVLANEPRGVLVIQGDRPARIFVDGALVVEGVQNSGPVSLDGGSHQVQVILAGGQVIDTTLVVRSRERLVYDYSRRSLTRRAN